MKIFESKRISRCPRWIIPVLIFILLVPAWIPDGSFSFAYNAYAKKGSYCSDCGRKLSNYLEYNGKRYCSKKCLHKNLPKCSVCGKPANIKRADGKIFCSKTCISKTWPICSFCKKHSQNGIKRGDSKVFLCKRCAHRPRCFACQMPADHSKFYDGRYICKHCNRTAVMNIEKAKRIANEVRNTMKQKLGISTDNDIAYYIVGQKKLKGKVKHDHQGVEFGLFLFEQIVEKTTTTTRNLLGKETKETKEEVKLEQNSIYFLFGIPEDKFREVAAHELAHDWMQEFYPNIKDLKIKEGWAEYIASLVNNIYGNSKMNRRMELNKNKIYGDGYRLIKKYVRDNNMDALFDMFEKAE